MANEDLYKIMDVFYSDTDLFGKRGSHVMISVGKDGGRKNKIIFLNMAEYHSILGKILGQDIAHNTKLSWDGTWERVEYNLRGELEKISLSQEQFTLLGGTKPKKSAPKPKNYDSFHEYPVKRIRN